MSISAGLFFSGLARKADKRDLIAVEQEGAQTAASVRSTVASLIAAIYSKEPPPIVLSPNSTNVADEASLVAAIAAGQAARLTADITLATTLNATGAEIQLNGFAIKTAGASSDPVTMITSTGPGLIVGPGLVEHNKTTDTSVETIFSLNTGSQLFRVHGLTLRVREFAAVVTGTFAFTDCKYEYHMGVNDSHRYFRVLGVSGDSWIDNSVFDCQPANPSTGVRYTNFILHQPTVWADGATLHVRGNKQGVGDLRQFFIGDTTGAAVQEGRLVLHDNEFNDLNGGIFLLGANRFNQFSSIVVTGNKQGPDGAAGGYKGVFFVDASGGALGTKCEFVHYGNTTQAGPLRTDYVSLDPGSDNIIARRNTTTIEPGQEYPQESESRSADGLAALQQQIAELQANAVDPARVDALETGKVDKETGKGLSTNDLTDALLEDLTNLKWTELAVQWSQAPNALSTDPTGSVYEYVRGARTLYRFVPTPYAPTQDAFYVDQNLTQLIAARGA
jgi:hypothetical protein